MAAPRSVSGGGRGGGRGTAAGCHVAQLEQLVWPYSERQFQLSKPIEFTVQDAPHLSTLTRFSRRVIVWKKPDTAFALVEPLRGSSGCPVLLTKPTEDGYKGS